MCVSPMRDSQTLIADCETLSCFGMFTQSEFITLSYLSSSLTIHCLNRTQTCPGNSLFVACYQ